MIIGITMMIAGPLLIYCMWKEASRDAMLPPTTITILAAITAALASVILGIIILYYELGWLVPPN